MTIQPERQSELPADAPAEATTFDTSTVDNAIRIGLLALLGYWSLKVIGPFLTIALWSAILSVALYPLFSWLARHLGGRRRLAALLVTLLCLIVVIGPVSWFGLGLVNGVQYAVDHLDAAKTSIPLPSESVKSWPLIGDRLFELWTLAATNIKAVLAEVAPTLKPIGGRLLGMAGSVGLGLVQFVAAIIIAGFLYSPGPQLTVALSAFLHRIFGGRSGQMLKLAGDTVRNVSRGVVGVAIAQSFLAALGFVAVGLPGAGFLSLVALILGIIQIGPSLVIIPVVIWSWFTMETASALLFTIYMIPVSVLDNVLRPLVMARGLMTPMPIILIGVMGGTIAYGISGLFLGPIVLSVAWVLLVAWVEEDSAGKPPGASI